MADGVLLHTCQSPHFSLLGIYDIGYPKLTRYELNLCMGAVDISTGELGLGDEFCHGTFVDLPFAYQKRFGRDARYGFATIVNLSLDSEIIYNRCVYKFELQKGEPAASGRLRRGELRSKEGRRERGRLLPVAVCHRQECLRRCGPV